ncbi:MAG: oligosaccharide flippase family protein [Polyangiales bacterium]
MTARPIAALARDGAIYTGGMLLARAMSFVMVPVYTHFLTPADYGLLELLDTADEVAVVALSAAIADPVLRHHHDAPDGPARDRVISTAMLSLAALSVVVTALGFAAAPALSSALFGHPGHAGLLRLTLASVAFQTVVEVPLARFRGTDAPLRFMGWYLARIAVGLALNVLFIAGMGMGVRGRLLSTLIASALITTTLSALTLRDVGARFDRDVFGAMLAFGWPLIPGALALIALQHGRSWVLNHWTTLAEVGFWALGWRVGTLASQVLGKPLRDAWAARMYTLWDASGPDGPRVFRSAATAVIALHVWAAASLAALAPDAVAALATAAYAPAARVAPAVAAAYAMREAAELFRNGLVLARDTRPVAWVEPALAVFDFALGAALVSRWGLTGAIVATPVVFTVYAVAMHLALRRRLDVPWRYGRLATIAALGLALGAGGNLLHLGGLWADVAVKAALCALWPLAAVALVFTDPDERAMVSALRRRLAWW